MKIFLLSLPFLTVYGAVYTQDIFIPFKGEREIVQVKDIKDYDTTRLRGSCGNYFMYEVVRDQKILRFQASSQPGDRPATSLYTTIGIGHIDVELNEEKKIPTAEYRKFDVWEKPRMIIRISKRDYEAAKCLPKPK